MKKSFEYTDAGFNLFWRDKGINEEMLLSRLPVIGGWLVKHTHFIGNRLETNCMTFVPDPDHEWQTKFSYKVT